VADASAQDVLDFWFGPGDDDTVIARNAARWWRADAGFDAQIRTRFGALRDRAIAGELDDWKQTPHGRLALIVLVDQFSRNLFRGDARAFAHDAHARVWTHEMLAAGEDPELRPIERVFCYLPLEHSEDRADQERSVELFTALRDSAPTASRDVFAGYLEYARRHRDVIARFGRFPHRNAALGRVSTREEITYLAEPGSVF